MDYPTAWALVRQTPQENHHPRCSFRQTNGAILCDCYVISFCHECGASLDGDSEVGVTKHGSVVCGNCASGDTNVDREPPGPHSEAKHYG